ncbi:hypothetical protein Tco_0542294 [Tanacetum coccineum]
MFLFDLTNDPIRWGKTIAHSRTLRDTEEEDVSSTNVCDLNLGGMVKGKEEVKEQGKEEDEMEINIEVEEVIKEDKSNLILMRSLTYNEEEGKVVFKQDDEKIMFKMLRTMKIFNQRRLMGLCTDSIPPSAYEENFSHGRTHYYQSLLIGDEYKQDNGDRRRIRLYLMRISLEVLRKFHWMILGGRFNQLSHVSSPLLSKPGEY